MSWRHGAAWLPSRWVGPCCCGRGNAWRPPGRCRRPPALNVLVKLGVDDRITVVMARSEMGQCEPTGQAKVLSDELDVDRSQVAIEHSPADRIKNNLAAVLEGLPPLRPRPTPATGRLAHRQGHARGRRLGARHAGRCGRSAGLGRLTHLRSREFKPCPQVPMNCGPSVTPHRPAGDRIVCEVTQDLATATAESEGACAPVGGVDQ